MELTKFLDVRYLGARFTIQLKPKIFVRSGSSDRKLKMYSETSTRFLYFSYNPEKLKKKKNRKNGTPLIVTVIVLIMNSLGFQCSWMINNVDSAVFLQIFGILRYVPRNP